jgi:Pyruvate/2-oxoacid:ferredoxin oxidoreductase delta subunit
MSLTDQASLRVVLYEGDGVQPLAAEERFATLSSLLEKGFAITRVTGERKVAPNDGAELLVLGRFDQGARPAGASVDGQVPIHFHDLSNSTAGETAIAAETLRAQIHAHRTGEWKPWFPVIDYDRCTNCMQCLSFCLFGVYGVDQAQQIQVQNHDSCKTNCPACSRVCPEAAIMFPKYKSGPINGDAVSSDDLQREKMKIDISALLGGDIYQMLRDRSERAKSRFSKERDSEKALKERQKCLVQLAQAGDIPPEVLMALPSREEIEEKARAAKAKAQQALAMQP